MCPDLISLDVRKHSVCVCARDAVRVCDGIKPMNLQNEICVCVSARCEWLGHL